MCKRRARRQVSGTGHACIRFPQTCAPLIRYCKNHSPRFLCCVGMCTSQGIHILYGLTVTLYTSCHPEHSLRLIGFCQPSRRWFDSRLLRRRPLTMTVISEAVILSEAQPNRKIPHARHSSSFARLSPAVREVGRCVLRAHHDSHPQLVILSGASAPGRCAVEGSPTHSAIPSAFASP